MIDWYLWRGLLYGETAESIFSAKSFYDRRRSGENETSAEKERFNDIFLPRMNSWAVLKTLCMASL